MRFFFLRAILIAVALAEGAWCVLYYFRPDVALGVVGRSVLDPVISRQYPLYLASAALAYGLTAFDPIAYARVAWICVIQRMAELAGAVADWHDRAIPADVFARIAAIELLVAVALSIALWSSAPAEGARFDRDRRDRGLQIALRIFGGLEIFWFLASTIFVQIGARLLHWHLLDAYTTQQQGLALLVIGLVSLLVASDVARYRTFVWVPVFSQLIGVANAFNEVRLGSITVTIAVVQCTIEFSIVFAFVYFSRRFLAVRIAEYS